MEVWRPCAMSSVALHGALPRRPRPDRTGAGRSGPERTAVAARTDGMVRSASRPVGSGSFEVARGRTRNFIK